MLLKNGDKVAVIAPSDCIEEGSADKGIAWLKKAGFIPVLSEHLYIDERYSNAKKQQIAMEINHFFCDNEIKALFCTRGGSGSLRILKDLDFELIGKHPKPVFGFSDSTTLQNALWQRSRVTSYSGFLLNYDFCNGDIHPIVEQSLFNIFSGSEYTLTGGKMLRKGKADGVLLGGNLSCLSRLCGTKYFPDLNGKILILEDCGEKSYKIDLMLATLKMQPSFKQLSGLVLGQFSNCTMTDAYDGTIEQIITQFLEDVHIPVIGDALYGHISDRYVVPIGARVILDAESGTLKVPAE